MLFSITRGPPRPPLYTLYKSTFYSYRNEKRCWKGVGVWGTKVRCVPIPPNSFKRYPAIWLTLTNFVAYSLPLYVVPISINCMQSLKSWLKCPSTTLPLVYQWFKVCQKNTKGLHIDVREMSLWSYLIQIARTLQTVMGKTEIGTVKCILAIGTNNKAHRQLG